MFLSRDELTIIVLVSERSVQPKRLIDPKDKQTVSLGLHRVRFAGGVGGDSTLSVIFLTPRVPVDLSSWGGVDSNPPVQLLLSVVTSLNIR